MDLLNPRRWFTAITTAPRKQPTLESTVKSLRAAWFAPHVYAEPNSPPVNAMTITHDEKLGVWFNWVFAARKAVESNREFALIVQDDIDVHPDTMKVLEHLFDHVVPRGPISVYTPRGYSHQNNDVRHPRRAPGLHPVVSEKLWGAVGIAYRHSELEQIIHHPLIESWRGHVPAKTKVDAVNSDVAIGRICKSLGLKIFFPTPSFATHTSRYSSIPGHGSNEAKRNRNAEAPADPQVPLIDQLFPGSRSMVR